MRYRPGKEAIVPDALSRRDQDTPNHLDPRLSSRELQVLPEQIEVFAGYITNIAFTNTTLEALSTQVKNFSLLEALELPTRKDLGLPNWLAGL